MFVCCECCVLSGRGLCDELITRLQESYRLCCVVVCDLENLKNEEGMTRFGSQRHWKKIEERTERKVSIFFNFNCLQIAKSRTTRQAVHVAWM